jgi:hypothetical protein
MADEDWRPEFEAFRKMLPEHTSEEAALEFYIRHLESPSIEEQLTEYAEQDSITKLQSIESRLEIFYQGLETLEAELSEITDKNSEEYKTKTNLKSLINRGARNTISELKTDALTSNRFEKISGLQGLIKGSNKDDLTDRMFWDYWYRKEDEAIDPSQYKFQPIDLGDQLSKAQVEYIQGLYARTVPVPSEIFPRDPCLVWCGAKDVDGYSKHKPPKDFKGSTLVHRFIYQAIHGELGDATIDHACGRVDCINPRHLRLLDRATNKAYGDPRKFMKGE